MVLHLAWRWSHRLDQHESADDETGLCTRYPAPAAVADAVQSVNAYGVCCSIQLL